MRLVLALLACVVTTATAHERHVTFAEVRHAPDEGVLQVVLDMDTADLDGELAARLDSPPVLETDAADSAIVALLKDHFVVRTVEGQACPLAWVGKEIGVVEASLYFTVAVPDTLDGLTLQQSLGIAFHAQQVNTVNVHAAGRMRTLVFTRGVRTLPLAPAH